ncbi:hypothetical protein DCAR_0418253 [Daucus carota subsp. sativus]|uniref:Uncharacterized protein n=1 Tax=Daucus carota subsp. sativus TaxID=79200 RepID=A0A165Z9Q1_DAUCS|nr:hypothetical protein DCAR_0418253 [Daucus carota subsp. sativus]
MAKLQFFCFCLVALLCSAESTMNKIVNYCEDSMRVDKCEYSVCLNTCLKKHPNKSTVAACTITNPQACTCFYRCPDS